MPEIQRYGNFMSRSMLVAILTATSTLVSTFIITQTEFPSWITPLVSFVTLFIGSFYAFKRQQKQITTELLSELQNFNKTFYGLTMAGSGENREIQIRFMLERVHISDVSQKETLQMRGSHIRACHDLIEKWFKCYRDEVEYFSKHPKSIDVDNTIRLISEFKQILSHYLEEVTNASIDSMNDIKPFPENLKEGFETKFDTFKIKYNHFVNKLNDYIQRLNKELSYQMDSADIIPKKLKLELGEIVKL